MITILRPHVARYGSLPWRSRSQHNLAAKSCPLNNFVIWSRILKLFHTSYHHIESICREQDLGCYLEGQGHSMTLKQNLVRPITSLFEVGFKTISQKLSPYWVDMLRAKFGSLPWRSRSQHDLAAKSCPLHNLVIWSLVLQLSHRNDHHIELMCRAQYLGPYLDSQGHSMTLQQNCIWPITLLYEVPFKTYFTEMITILRRRVASNIWVATLKVKVTAWPCSKNVSRPQLGNLKSDFTTILQKWSLDWDVV